MYELVKLGKNTYYINAFCNVGVYVNGTDATLIDSGLDDENAVIIDDLLKKEGLLVKNIIITHAHADHIGSSRYFVDKYNATVLCTKADTAIANISILNTSLIYGGLPSNIARGKMLYAEPCKAIEITKNNLPKGLEIVDLRGHSISMIGVKTDDNVLFVADSVISEKTIQKFPLTYLLNVNEYLSSMDKILSINADYYVPAHAEVTTDIAPLVSLNKQAVQKNIDDILSVMTKPIEIGDLVFEYAKKFGYVLKTSQFFVVTTTIKNYLAHLESEGKVKAYIENNRLFWEKL